MEKINVSYISDNAICTGCGSCVGVCPSSAVIIDTNTAGFLIAKVDDDLCIDCEKCLSICPSNPERIISIGSDDVFHGVCLGSYIGYARDKKIRHKSQSGGIVTALLCYLIKTGRIEGAIVNKLNSETKRPEAFFATTEEELLDACGSYYSQSSVVDKILENRNKVSAAVVLGCQAEGLELIKNNFVDMRLPEYRIGLVCLSQHSGNKIDDLITQSGLDVKRVMEFRFRDKGQNGWPGKIRISTEDEDFWYPKEKRQDLKRVYEVHRCIPCYNQLNIFSDIVCGDPWGIQDKHNSEGHTVIIARTEKGKALLEMAESDGAIVIESLGIEEIIRGQTVDGRHKTKFFASLEIFKKKGWVFPFNEESFIDVPYAPAKKGEMKELVERLEYSRDLYMTEDREEYLVKINNKKKDIKIYVLQQRIQSLFVSVVMKFRNITNQK